MELDELKTSWQSMNARLEEMQSLIQTGHTKTAANSLRREPIFELVVAALTVLWSGNFLADNFAKVLRSPAGAIPAGLLWALGVFTIWLSIRQLITISELDYASPILDTQRKLANLRSLRVRSTQFVLLSSLPLWIVFPLLAGQAIFGFEFYRAVSGPWIVSNLAFGIALVGGIVLVAKRFGARSRVLQRVNNIFAGTAILEAERLIAEVNRFEQG